MTTAIQLVTSPDWGSVRLPSPDLERDRLLVEANDRGREGALRVLQGLLPDLRLADLAQTTDSATFTVGHANPELTAIFDPSAQLDHLLTWGDFHGLQIQLVREQERPNPVEFLASAGHGRRSRVRVGDLSWFIRDGFTVVLNGIDLRDQPSMRLAEAAERVFGTMVNINGYLSRQPPMSFGAHWDDQETIILQLLGRKSWIVEQPRALSMLRNVHGPATSGEVVWDGILEPGSALYVPRGWGHNVRSVNELSFHYTVTIPRLNGVRLLESIVQRRAPRELGARSLPVVSRVDDFDGLELDIGDKPVQAALALARTAITSRSTQLLSVARRALQGDTDGLWVRCPFPGGWVAVDDAPSGVRRAAGAGIQLEFEASAEGRILRWVDGLGRPWPQNPVDDAIVGRLVRMNVLEVTEDPLSWGFPMADFEGDCAIVLH